MQLVWRAQMAHVTQSRPGYGFDFQVKFPKHFEHVPSLLGSGAACGLALIELVFQTLKNSCLQRVTGGCTGGAPPKPPTKLTPQTSDQNSCVPGGVHGGHAPHLHCCRTPGRPLRDKLFEISQVVWGSLRAAPKPKRLDVERIGNGIKGFTVVHLKSKAIIWHMCAIFARQQRVHGGHAPHLHDSRTPGVPLGHPLSSESGICKTVKARFWT